MKNQQVRFLFIFLLIAAKPLFAQQWVEKKYTYDSTYNVPYGTALNFTGGTDSLELDIYTPICNGSTIASRPLILFIHGGAFLAGSKEDASIVKLCKEFAKRGYVTAGINYRLGFVSDDIPWSCNYSNYECVFATDSAEWYRALYRGIQDGKGALRFLINHHNEYRIDTANVFVAGESAGAFISLGIGLLDTLTEKFSQANSIPNAPIPHNSTFGCSYNSNAALSGTFISRPDLGTIDGTIEPTNINYTIKGIGNMYGGVFSDLLKHHSITKPKPSIYSFHQPCDLVVPIDSGKIYAGLSWCFTNGYNCYAINNTAKIYGSRAISTWNTTLGYGYNIHDEFTGTAFPYNFLIGSGSCADQVNNPCHAYDNVSLRENNLADFFAGLVTTHPVCDTATTIAIDGVKELENGIKIYPNPFSTKVTVEVAWHETTTFYIYNTFGNNIYTKTLTFGKNELELTIKNGVYLFKAVNAKGVFSKSLIHIN